MTPTQPSPVPLAHTIDGDAHRRHAVRVPCPEPPHGCTQPAGSPCLGADGRELAGPGHPHRLIAADRRYPTEIPPGPPEPDPSAPAGRRLVSADRIRTELAVHRQRCPHGCSTVIVWARNGRGDRVPVDAEPTPPAAPGRREPRLCTLTVDGDGTVRAVVVSPAAVPGARDHGTPLHQAHRQTCTKAHLWSRHHRQ